MGWQVQRLQRHPYAVRALQGKLEAEMATAAQLPDALDQVPLDDAHARGDARWRFLFTRARAGF